MQLYFVEMTTSMENTTFVTSAESEEAALAWVTELEGDPDRKRVKESGPIECEWFAGCEKAAVEMLDHPVLKSVPTCADHVAWVKRMQS